MERAIEPGSRSRSLRKNQILALAAVLLVVCAWMFFVSRRATRIESIRGKDPVSPYLNTRSEVKYLGDAACVGCHAKSGETFRQHPMGRSFAPVREPSVTKADEGTGRTLFESQGLQYSIDDRDGHVFHQETRRDAAGRIVAKTEAEVKFVLGSGRQGAAYLIERDGSLFESPITWYSRNKRWGLSPGFEVLNHHFDRPINPNCLFCHANRVTREAGPINGPRPPIFQGHAIGCERCHGPGELHIARPTMVDGEDMTIVNPADLPQALRDDVCAQCHLAGDQRVVRAGRQNEDYRPGLPFPSFWTVFVQPPDRAESRFVGQFEQMHDSRCFRGSQGLLGCISCHDPHHFPAPEEKVAYYRDRCLECHAEAGCRLPRSDRLERSRDDNCAGCHMPRASSVDIPHSASANHRIPRDPERENRFTAKPGKTTRDRLHMIFFGRERLDAEEQARVERDRGVALCRDGAAGARLALPLLEAALAARSDDATAWECKGYALGSLGRQGEALAAFREALTWEPDRESALVEAARAATKMDRRPDAAAYLLRAIAINPGRSGYQAELARVYFNGRDWQASAAACRAALRLSASSITVRKLLIQCLLNLGNSEAARGELDTVLGFDPPDRADLLRSFSLQSRSGGNSP